MPDADIAIIDRAARLRGRSRTDFMRDAAVRAAEDVLMKTTPIRMSAEGFDDAVDDGAAAFWRRWGFLPSKDDSLTLFRSISDIAASLGVSQQ